jgi:hypothetical protein
MPNRIGGRRRGCRVEVVACGSESDDGGGARAVWAMVRYGGGTVAASGSGLASTVAAMLTIEIRVLRFGGTHHRRL